MRCWIQENQETLLDEIETDLIETFGECSTRSLHLSDGQKQRKKRKGQDILGVCTQKG